MGMSPRLDTLNYVILDTYIAFLLLKDSYEVKRQSPGIGLMRLRPTEYKVIAAIVNIESA